MGMTVRTTNLKTYRRFDPANVASNGPTIRLSPKYNALRAQHVIQTQTVNKSYSGKRDLQNSLPSAGQVVTVDTGIMADKSSDCDLLEDFVAQSGKPSPLIWRDWLQSEDSKGVLSFFRFLFLSPLSLFLSTDSLYSPTSARKIFLQQP